MHFTRLRTFWDVSLNEVAEEVRAILSEWWERESGQAKLREYKLVERPMIRQSFSNNESKAFTLC